VIIKHRREAYIRKHCIRFRNSMYSPQGFVKQLSNGKWGYELTLRYVVSNECDGRIVRVGGRGGSAGGGA